jgi:hypothetical protein
MLPQLRNQVGSQDHFHRPDLGTYLDWWRIQMSLPAIIDTDTFEFIEKVAGLYTQGVTSPHTIARRLGIKVVEARSAIEQWQEIIRHDSDAQDAARDALNVMLQRYDILLTEANQNLNDLKGLAFDEKISAQINTTIKTIADLDKTRVDLLQKAGLLDANELGDELAEREERETMILGILKNDLCHECRITVRDKISKLTGTVQGTVVEAEVVDV